MMKTFIVSLGVASLCAADKVSVERKSAAVFILVRALESPQESAFISGPAPSRSGVRCLPASLLFSEFQVLFVTFEDMTFVCHNV